MMTLLDQFENPHFSAAAQPGSDGTSPFTVHLVLPDVFNCSAAKLKEKEDPSTLLYQLRVSSGGSHIDTEEVWQKRNPDEAHKLCLLVIALSAILAHHQRFTRAVTQ